MNEHGALLNNKCRKIRTRGGNWSATNLTLTAVEINSRLPWSQVYDELPELWHGSILAPEYFDSSLVNYRTIYLHQHKRTRRHNILNIVTDDALNPSDNTARATRTTI
jgi:hypothetical protein